MRRLALTLAASAEPHSRRGRNFERRTPTTGRTVLVLMSVLAVAVVAPGAAVAKRGGTDRPWKSSGTATATLNLTTGTGTNVGTGHAAHLGKTGLSATFALTPTAVPNTFNLTGTTTVVAANGDRLFTTFTGTTTSTGGATASVTFVNTITGGTGRFADASGSFTTTGSSVIVSIVGTTATLRQTFTARG